MTAHNKVLQGMHPLPMDSSANLGMTQTTPLGRTRELSRYVPCSAISVKYFHIVFHAKIAAYDLSLWR